MKIRKGAIFSIIFNFIILILLIFLIVIIPIYPKQKEFKPDLELMLSIDKDQLKIGDEVLIKYEIKNNDNISYKKGCYYIFLELKEKDKNVKLKIADLSHDINSKKILKGVFPWKIEFIPKNSSENFLNLAMYSKQEDGTLILIDEKSILIKFI